MNNHRLDFTITDDPRLIQTVNFDGMEVGYADRKASFLKRLNMADGPDLMRIDLLKNHVGPPLNYTRDFLQKAVNLTSEEMEVDD